MEEILARLSRLEAENAALKRALASPAESVARSTERRQRSKSPTTSSHDRPQSGRRTAPLRTGFGTAGTGRTGSTQPLSSPAAAPPPNHRSPPPRLIASVSRPTPTTAHSAARPPRSPSPSLHQSGSPRLKSALKNATASSSSPSLSRALGAPRRAAAAAEPEPSTGVATSELYRPSEADIDQQEARHDNDGSGQWAAAELQPPDEPRDEATARLDGVLEKLERLLAASSSSSSSPSAKTKRKGTKEASPSSSLPSTTTAGAVESSSQDGGRGIGRGETTRGRGRSQSKERRPKREGSNKRKGRSKSKRREAEDGGDEPAGRLDRGPNNDVGEGAEGVERRHVQPPALPAKHSVANGPASVPFLHAEPAYPFPLHAFAYSAGPHEQGADAYAHADPHSSSSGSSSSASLFYSSYSDVPPAAARLFADMRAFAEEVVSTSSSSSASGKASSSSFYARPLFSIRDAVAAATAGAGPGATTTGAAASPAPAELQPGTRGNTIAPPLAVNAPASFSRALLRYTTIPAPTFDSPSLESRLPSRELPPALGGPQAGLTFVPAPRSSVPSSAASVPPTASSVAGAMGHHHPREHLVSLDALLRESLDQTEAIQQQHKQPQPQQQQQQSPVDSREVAKARYALFPSITATPELGLEASSGARTGPSLPPEPLATIMPIASGGTPHPAPVDLFAASYGAAAVELPSASQPTANLLKSPLQPPAAALPSEARNSVRQLNAYSYPGPASALGIMRSMVTAAPAISSSADSSSSAARSSLPVSAPSSNPVTTAAAAAAEHIPTPPQALLWQQDFHNLGASAHGNPHSQPSLTAVPTGGYNYGSDHSSGLGMGMGMGLGFSVVNPEESAQWALRGL